MARKIVITSGKGGVGKTTVVANLGIKLASMGYKVVMLDIDIGLNNLDVVMGIENKVVYDICDVIEGKCRVRQALVQDFRVNSLFVLPSNHIYSNTAITSYSIKDIVDDLAESFDFVLIDCPAGIDNGFHRAVFCADEAIVVATPHLSSIRDADKVLTILSAYNLSSIGFVINRVRGDLIMNGEMIDVDNICSLLKAKFLGVVPDDDVVATTCYLGLNRSDGDRAFSILARNIAENRNDIYNYLSKYKGIIGSFRRAIRKKV